MCRTPYEAGGPPASWHNSRHRPSTRLGLQHALALDERTWQQSNHDHDHHLSTNLASFHSLLRSHRAVVAMFMSATCPLCRVIEPVFEEVARAKTKVLAPHSSGHQGRKGPCLVAGLLATWRGGISSSSWTCWAAEHGVHAWV
jgi:hypothetical protein